MIFRGAPVNVDGIVSALRVPAELGSLAFARCAIACQLERAGWPVADAGRILLASGEAIVNAIEHGSPGDGMVEVELLVGQSDAHVWVRDQGRPGAALPRLPASPPPISSPRGRGLIIIRGSADQIAIRRCGTGTEIALRFERGDASASAQETRRAA